MILAVYRNPAYYASTQSCHTPVRRAGIRTVIWGGRLCVRRLRKAPNEEANIMNNRYSGRTRDQGDNDNQKICMLERSSNCDNPGVQNTQYTDIPTIVMMLNVQEMFRNPL